MKDDPSLFENYRPISLLPTISKVLEKLIFIQVYSYFNEKNILYNNQYGFRAKYSREFADFSKACDTIDHNVLQSKLAYYGLNGYFQSILYLLGVKKHYCYYMVMVI